MDGHKARVGSRVIGGRGFLKPEKPESVKPWLFPKLKTCSLLKDRKGIWKAAEMRNQPSVWRGFWPLKNILSSFQCCIPTLTTHHRQECLQTFKNQMYVCSSGYDLMEKLAASVTQCLVMAMLISFCNSPVWSLLWTR